MGIAETTVTLLANQASTGGFRFENVQVPQGATIVSAALVLWIYTYGSMQQIKVWGDNEDNCATFALADLPDGRPFTGASNINNVTALTGYLQRTLSAGSGVQEIVNRAGWTPGNALALLLRNINNVGINPSIYAFEYDPAKAATLAITYT